MNTKKLTAEAVKEFEDKLRAEIRAKRDLRNNAIGSKTEILKYV